MHILHTNKHLNLKYFLQLIVLTVLLLMPLTGFTKDKNEFILQFLPANSQLYRDIGEVLKSSQQYQLIVDRMNQQFSLPRPIIINFSAIDAPLYEFKTQTINISYPAIFVLSASYFQKYPGAQDAQMINFTIRATSLMLYHAIALALINEYQIPIVHQEKDVSDLAILLALNDTVSGYNDVIQAATLFEMYDDSVKNKPSSDSEFDPSQYENMLCIAYGKYPDAILRDLGQYQNKKLMQYIIHNTAKCKKEYQEKLNYWSTVLLPYKK